MIPGSLREQFGVTIEDKVSVSFSHGSRVMKPAKPEKFKKIKKEDLPERPAWLKEQLERIKESDLGKMSEEERSQWVNDYIERVRTKSRASNPAP